MPFIFFTIDLSTVSALVDFFVGEKKSYRNFRFITHKNSLNVGFITKKGLNYGFITHKKSLNVGFITGKRVNEEAATGHAS